MCEEMGAAHGDACKADWLARAGRRYAVASGENDATVPERELMDEGRRSVMACVLLTEDESMLVPVDYLRRVDVHRVAVNDLLVVLVDVLDGNGDEAARWNCSQPLATRFLAILPPVVLLHAVLLQTQDSNQAKG